MPFPEEDGYYVEPGTATRISIRKKVHHRLGKVDNLLYTAVYSDCIDELNDFTIQETNVKDAYTFERMDVSYSKMGCLKTCQQRTVMEKCGVS